MPSFLQAILRFSNRKFIFICILISVSLGVTFMLVNTTSRSATRSNNDMINNYMNNMNIEVNDHHDQTLTDNQNVLERSAFNKMSDIGHQLSVKLNAFLDESQKNLVESWDFLKRGNAAATPFEDFFPGLKVNGTNLLWIHDDEFHIPTNSEKNHGALLDVNHLMNADGSLSISRLDDVLNLGVFGIHLRVTSFAQAKRAISDLMTRTRKMQAPVLISANVLRGPNYQRCRDGAKNCSEPLVLHSLIKLMEDSNFGCTIGLSWTETFLKKSTNHGYTWEMVYDMVYLIRDSHLDRSRPLVIIVRAALARRSIAQLSWMVDITNANLVLEASLSDARLDYLASDIVLVYKFLPPHRVLLRVPRELRRKVVEISATYQVPADWLDVRHNLSYRDGDWSIQRPLSDSKYFMRGSQAVLMYPGGLHDVYLGSMATYHLVPRLPHRIVGRVAFFEDPKILKAGQFQAGLKIYVASDFDHLDTTSTMVMIASNGYYTIASHSTRRDVVVMDDKMKDANRCYDFRIESETRGVDVTISSPIDCNFSPRAKVREIRKIRLDITLHEKAFHVYVQPLGKSAPVFIDQLRVT